MDRRENWTMCSFQCQCGGAGYEHNMRCVVKFRRWHWSVSHFWCGCGHGNEIGGECRCGDGDEQFVGSRRLEGSLRMQGRKFLFYFLDLLLRGQLKGHCLGCGCCANQERVGWSGHLTLVIKCSDKLFHVVNEDGEFGGFGFRGGSGQSSMGAEAVVP